MKFEDRPEQIKIAKKIVNYLSKDTEIVLLESPTGCLAPDTKIRLLNGTTSSIKDLINMKNFWVISCSNGQITPGLATKVWKTKRVSQLIKIILDDNSFLETTIEHKYMLRDGSYKEAQNLTVGESLMPLYIKKNINPNNQEILNQKIKNVLYEIQKVDPNYNHKIKEIKLINRKEDVYDMEVSGFNNFAVVTNESENSGIFVHNSGKSAIAYLIHKFMREKNSDHKSIVMMHQKLLQDQYSSFLDHQTGVVSIKGKDNYDCSLVKNLSVSDAPCQYLGACSMQKDCEYFIKRKMMNTMPLVITNYQLVYSLLDVGSWQNQFDLSIYDECHNNEDIFTDYKVVSLDNLYLDKIRQLEISIYNLGFQNIASLMGKIIDSLLKFDKDNYLDSFEKIFSIKTEILLEASDILDAEQMENISKKDEKLLRSISQYLTFEKRAVCKWRNYLETCNKTRFVFDDYTEDEMFSYELIPLKIDTLFAPVADYIGKKKIFMSAFIGNPEHFLSSLGLTNTHKFISLDSSFDVENRRVVFAVTEYLNNSKLYGNYDLTNYFDIIYQICKLHAEKNESGWIYTPSYKFIDLLRENLEVKLANLGFLLISNKNSDERDDVIEVFRDTSFEKRLLISPSFAEGVNFEHDISRFQIITKAPFKSLGSKFVKEKLKESHIWYEISALKKILQATGRSDRAKDDYSITYIIDGHCLKLYRKYENDIPKYFRESVIIS